MDWSERFSWLLALRAQREAESAAAAADPADMGTAFGLDASFDAVGLPIPSWRHTLPAGTEIPWESRLIRRSGL
jgi:hypothetical protein